MQASVIVWRGSFYTVATPAVLAQRELYTLQRLTSIDGKAALVEHMYLVADVFQGIENLDLENQSLSRVVSDEFHLHATAADQSFDICYPELKVAQALELDSAQPALHVSRLLHFGDLTRGDLLRYLLPY